MGDRIGAADVFNDAVADYRHGGMASRPGGARCWYSRARVRSRALGGIATGNSTLVCRPFRWSFQHVRGDEGT